MEDKLRVRGRMVLCEAERPRKVLGMSRSDSSSELVCETELGAFSSLLEVRRGDTHPEEPAW